MADFNLVVGTPSKLTATASKAGAPVPIPGDAVLAYASDNDAAVQIDNGAGTITGIGSGATGVQVTLIVSYSVKGTPFTHSITHTVDVTLGPPVEDPIDAVDFTIA